MIMKVVGEGGNMLLFWSIKKDKTYKILYTHLHGSTYIVAQKVTV